jgi:phage shock protein C
MQVNPRRLYRSRTDRQLAGVAGGMAEFFGIDPTIVRILWILSVLLGGFTLLLYPIMAIVVPLAPAGAWTPTPGTTGAWGPTSPTSAPGAPTATGDGATAEGGEPGQAWQTSPDATSGAAPLAAPAGWTWTPAAPPAPATRGLGASVYLGVLLVVFGVFAFIDGLVPGWVGHGSAGPAVLVALGAILLVGAVRRTTES